MEGDAREILPTIPRVDHVITDGPYGVGSYAETSDDGPYVEALRWAREHAGSIAFFGYPETLVAWIVALGWPAPDEWVTWYPSNAEAKAGARSGKHLPRLTEHVAIYGATPGVRRVVRERTQKSVRLNNRIKALGNVAQLGDVWTDPSPGIGFNAPDRLHPNEKPVSALEKLVELVSGNGDVVCDMFCGSGTTGVAALRLGRRFIGIERDATYARLAADRLRAEERGSTLQAARAGQLPLLAGGER